MKLRQISIQWLMTVIVAPLLAACVTVPVPPPSPSYPPASGYVCDGTQPLHWPAKATGLLKSVCPNVPQSDYPSRSVIVFVHGLDGDSVSTWFNNKSPGVFWPTLVKGDHEGFDNFDVYSFGYPTGLFIGDQLYVEQLVEQMSRKLENDKVLEHKQVYFVAHSMGGIIVRNFILDRARQRRNIQLIHYFGTPGQGSVFANLISGISGGKAASVLQMATLDSTLMAYQRNWTASAQFPDPPLPKVSCTCETASMLPRFMGNWLMVSRESCSSMCLVPGADGQVRPEDAKDLVADAQDEKGKLLFDHKAMVKPTGYEHSTYKNFKSVNEKNRPKRPKINETPPPAPIDPDLTGCPVGQGDPFTANVAQPYDATLQMVKGDFLVIENSDPEGLFPVSLTAQSYVPLTVVRDSTALNKCVVFKDQNGIVRPPLVRYVLDKSGPAVVRFKRLGPIPDSQPLAGVVQGKVYSLSLPAIKRVVAEDLVVEKPPPPLCGITSPSMGDCTVYATGLAYARPSKTGGGQIVHSQHEELVRAIKAAQPAKVIIRGFSSPEPMSCAAWKRTVTKNPKIKYLSGWICKDGSKDANANLLLSKARAAYVKDGIVDYIPHNQVDALGCGTQLASATRELRGVVVEMRRDSMELPKALLDCSRVEDAARSSTFSR